MTIAYRTARHDDWPAFDALERAVWSPLGIVTTPKDDFSRLVEIGGTLFVVAMDGDRMAGYINGCLVDLDPATIGDADWNHVLHSGFTGRCHDPSGAMVYGLTVAVHPDYRRAGIADEVLGRQIIAGRELGKRWYMTYVRIQGLASYLTACDIPQHAGEPNADVLDAARVYLKLGLQAAGQPIGEPLASAALKQLPAPGRLDAPSALLTTKHGVIVCEVVPNFSYVDPPSANCQAIVIGKL